MKLIIFLVASLLFMESCSDNGNSPNGNNVQFTSGISQTVLKSSVYKSGETFQSEEYADSLRITDFKMLISRVKFHGGSNVSDDTTFDDSKSLQFVTGAFVVHSDSSNYSAIIADAALKAGTYNKIKIEMHRLKSTDLSIYSDKNYFQDFTTSDRNTIAVRGKFYQDGIAKDFVYFTDVVLNYTYNVNPPLVVAETGEYRFSFEFDSAEMFKDTKGNILLPNDPKNRNDIEKNIKKAMKLYKKLNK